MNALASKLCQDMNEVNDASKRATTGRHDSKVPLAKSTLAAVEFVY